MKLIIWIMRMIYILIMALCFITGGAILAYMTLPFTPETIIQFISGLLFLMCGLAVSYFVVDSWKEI